MIETSKETINETFDEDYFMRGPETGKSNYYRYSWLPELTIPMAIHLTNVLGAKYGDTLLDFGCARGFVVKALRILNVKAFGCDISEWAVRNCDPDVRDFVGHGYEGEYDFLFCKDVLEHIPGDELNVIIPKLLEATKKKALFIVPLARSDGGSYVYPNDERDGTHIHRLTLDSWHDLIRRHAEGFKVYTSPDLDGLKPPVRKHPGCAGFIFCVRTQGQVRPPLSSRPQPEPV